MVSEIIWIYRAILPILKNTLWSGILGVGKTVFFNNSSITIAETLNIQRICIYSVYLYICGYMRTLVYIVQRENIHGSDLYADRGYSLAGRSIQCYNNTMVNTIVNGCKQRSTEQWQYCSFKFKWSRKPFGIEHIFI